MRFRRMLDSAGGGDTMEFLQHVETQIADPWPMTLSVGHVEMVETSYIDVQQTAKLIMERVSDKAPASAPPA